MGLDVVGVTFTRPAAGLGQFGQSCFAGVYSAIPPYGWEARGLYDGGEVDKLLKQLWLKGSRVAHFQ